MCINVKFKYKGVKAYPFSGLGGGEGGGEGGGGDGVEMKHGMNNTNIWYSNESIKLNRPNAYNRCKI